jgi:hypothetical protein
MKKRIKMIEMKRFGFRIGRAAAVAACIFLAGACGSSPDSVHTPGGGPVSDGNFELDGKGTITKYTGTDTDIIIPAKIEGRTVRGIGEGAFKESKTTSVTIPDGVTFIGKDAFYGCEELASISIPKSVTSIGYGAFFRCKGLTGISLPSGVTSIASTAFWSCGGLTSITIPAGVTSLGDMPFRFCGNLAEINVDAGNATYSSMEGILFDKAKTALLRYPEAKRELAYTIPEGVKQIGEGAFRECRALTGITIPSSVTSIERVAFFVCRGLTGILIPAGVTSIGSQAFDACSNLKTVMLSDRTKTGNKAFPDGAQIAYINMQNNNLMAASAARIDQIRASIEIDQAADSLWAYVDKNERVVVFVFSANNTFTAQWYEKNKEPDVKNSIKGTYSFDNNVLGIRGLAAVLSDGASRLMTFRYTGGQPDNSALLPFKLSGDEPQTILTTFTIIGNMMVNNRDSSICFWLQTGTPRFEKSGGTAAFAAAAREDRLIGQIKSYDTQIAGGLLDNGLKFTPDILELFWKRGKCYYDLGNYSMAFQDWLGVPFTERETDKYNTWKQAILDCRNANIPIPDTAGVMLKSDRDITANTRYRYAPGSNEFMVNRSGRSYLTGIDLPSIRLQRGIAAHLGPVVGLQGYEGALEFPPGRILQGRTEGKSYSFTDISAHYGL